MTLRRILLIAMAMTSAAVVTPPARAFPSAAGVAFACDATLTSSGQGGSGICGDGRLPSAARVEAAGYDDRGLTYIVDGLAPLRAEFYYSSACIAGEPALAGTAEGSIWISGVGAIHDDKPTRATLDVQFTWTRLGTNIVLRVTSSRFYFDDGGTATGILGEGHATIVPMRSDTNCPYGESGEWALSGELMIAS